MCYLCFEFQCSIRLLRIVQMNCVCTTLSVFINKPNEIIWIIKCQELIKSKFIVAFILCNKCIMMIGIQLRNTLIYILHHKAQTWEEWMWWSGRHLPSLFGLLIKTCKNKYRIYPLRWSKIPGTKQLNNYWKEHGSEVKKMDFFA